MLCKTLIILTITYCVHSYLLNKERTIVYPKFYSSVIRQRRDITLNVHYDFEEKIETIQLGNLNLELKNNENFIIAHDFKVDLFKNYTNFENCRFLTGKNEGEYFSVLSVCEEKVIGLINKYDELYIVEPLDQGNNSHVIYKSRYLEKRKKRDLEAICGTTEFQNIDSVEEEDASEESGDNGGNDELVANLTLRTENQDDDIMGYFYDTAWETHIFKKRKRPKISAPRRWLEIAIGVDYSVINFHGLDKIQHYLLALMNIVSAIYQDPSLESNLQLVITRVVLYDNKKHGQVREKNARKSLENVNAWNRRLHANLLSGESRHDLAIWLTRLDLGGPSGYAPVGGCCNPIRSCTLNRDEGLTSAFIIAHEMAHILGLTHDGDRKSGNKCVQEAQEGSVMAPMVAATFHKFTWSTCSKIEFHKNIMQWPCLMNPPPGVGEHVLKATLHTTFSMDEQCRIEFGDGYAQCTSFDMTEPCFHLWCGHYKSPTICKTKKGPPLEGTECGYDKWCINGYCKDVDVQNDYPNIDPVIHNPRDGGWNNWTNWQPCSRTCGFGAQFRTRNCDNPKPAFGGNYCQGPAEEFRICAKNLCPEPLIDIREEQCKRLNKIINFENTTLHNMTWIPHEHKEKSMKCQLICKSKQTQEIFFTGENLLDGTPCSYDENGYICVQGDCQKIGCDGSLTVEKINDDCGICNGNNSKCKENDINFQRNIRRENSRVIVLPRLARNILVECNISTVRDPLDKSVKLHLRDRRKNRYNFIGNEDEIILKGAKFVFKKNEKNIVLRAKGPTLAEIIVSLSASSSAVNSGLGMTVKASYVVDKTKVNQQKVYKWEIGGWGPCSASCGGGKRQRTVTCRNQQSKFLVPKRFCPLSEKPTLMIQDCNIFSCRFHWQPGQWEHCSANCGSNGVQHRELYCVHYLSNSTQPWKDMVKPDRCPRVQPEVSKPCNRIPCTSYWNKDGWSQCSASCGDGFKTLQYVCSPLKNETLYSCGPKPIDVRRPCGGYKRRTNPLCRKGKRKNCTTDVSQYCALTHLISKYCTLPPFRRICCKFCANNTLPE